MYPVSVLPKKGGFKKKTIDAPSFMEVAPSIYIEPKNMKIHEGQGTRSTKKISTSSTNLAQPELPLLLQPWCCEGRLQAAHGNCWFQMMVQSALNYIYYMHLLMIIYGKAGFPNGPFIFCHL